MDSSLVFFFFFHLVRVLFRVNIKSRMNSHGFHHDLMKFSSHQMDKFLWNKVLHLFRFSKKLCLQSKPKLYIHTNKKERRKRFFLYIYTLTIHKNKKNPFLFIHFKCYCWSNWIQFPFAPRNENSLQSKRNIHWQRWWCKHKKNLFNGTNIHIFFNFLSQWEDRKTKK